MDVGADGSVSDRMREVRRLLARTEFAGAAELAGSAGEGARAAGDVQSWRRFACRRATALYSLGRFPEALELADAVLASAVDGEHLHTQAHAANIGTIAADRVGRDDTLARLDAAVALGERIEREQGRIDSLYRTAWTAGTLGLAELGEAIFSGIAGGSGREDDVPLPPATVAFLAGQQLVVRNWWALTLEHAGDARSSEVYLRNIDTVRRLPELLPVAELPARTTAVFRAFEGFALAALGRSDEADVALSVAEASLPWPTLDIPSSATTLLCTAARMRPQAVTDPELVLAASKDLVHLARLVGDRRGEAEHLRLAAVAARRTGDGARAAVAEDRFTALVERLDWSRRLQAARMTTVHSLALREIAGSVRPDVLAVDAAVLDPSDRS